MSTSASTDMIRPLDVDLSGITDAQQLSQTIRRGVISLPDDPYSRTLKHKLGETSGTLKSFERSEGGHLIPVDGSLSAWRQIYEDAQEHYTLMKEDERLLDAYKHYGGVYDYDFRVSNSPQTEGTHSSQNQFDDSEGDMNLRDNRP